MRSTWTISQQPGWAGAVRFANARLSDDKTVAKIGHPVLKENKQMQKQNAGVLRCAQNDKRFWGGEK
jgi:hypothetical protein